MNFRSNIGLKPARALTIAAALGLALLGCGEQTSSDAAGPGWGPGAENNHGGSPPTDPAPPEPDPEAPGGGEDPFEPEQEEFLVRELATTAAHVFVPNSAPESHTVAVIDGRDFSIQPIPVGAEPTLVRAAEVQGQGDVAYVLNAGDSTVAIIRAEESAQEPEDKVNLLRVPRETNALALSPDGRHLLAYIDPDRPFSEHSSMASLQSAALIRLGDSRAEDRVFELSLTRLIRQIEFSQDSAQLILVGQEGINQILLDEIQTDRMIPPLALRLSGSDFPASDYQVELSPAGDILVARHSDFEGVLFYRLSGDEPVGEARLVELSAVPTDLDLFVDAGGDLALFVTLRDANEVAIIDVEATLLADEEAPPQPLILPAEEVQPGLATFTPRGDQALLYSTLVDMPSLGVLDIESGALQAYPLRNRIRSLAVSPDSESAVVVHKKREGHPPAGADPLETFQYSHGLTLVDLATGYRRPLSLKSEPADLVMVEQSDDTPLLFVMQPSQDASARGFSLINLKNYRSDFHQLPRQPEQMGRVADKVFISQTSREGRITFVDIDTGAQRTISGFELNAGIK